MAIPAIETIADAHPSISHISEFVFVSASAIMALLLLKKQLINIVIDTSCMIISYAC